MGEEIVVYVGKNCELVAGLELTKSGNGVGPGLPGGERVGKGTHFFGGWSKSKLSGKLANNRFQDLAIRKKCALFGTLLEVSVEFEESSIVDLFPVGGENATKRREDSGFPVDQRSVTVEGENFEAGEVEHGADTVLRDCELRSLPEQGLEVTARGAIELFALQFEHLSEFESDVGLGRQDNLLVS